MRGRLSASGCDGRVSYTRSQDHLILTFVRQKDSKHVFINFAVPVRLSFDILNTFSLLFNSHFVPNLTFGAPLVKCLRKKVPNAFFGEYIKQQG